MAFTMNIPNICTSISENLSHNLRLATTDDERQQYLSAALKGIGEQVIPSLNRLLAEKGEESPELNEARMAALDLATIICLDFIRKCTDYRRGISCLEKIATSCREPQLQRKLVIYTNQLKKKWNVVEPGGIIHNPRARKLVRQPGVSATFVNAIMVTLLFGSALYLFSHFDPTSLIFSHWNESRQQMPAPQVQESRQEDVAPKENLNAPVEPTAALAPPVPAGEFYTFTDRQGVIHIVNDPEKVSPQLRQGVTVTRSTAPRRDITPVVINGNQVLVPVTLSYRGRSATAMLLLDTGASVTTINEQLAARLGVDPMYTRSGTSTVADGRTVGSRSFVVDSLVVGPRSFPQLQTSILPGSGGVGHDGLLGMDFLKNLRYHVDFSRSVIEWGG
jgi:predicted aspartyl protease